MKPKKKTKSCSCEMNEDIAYTIRQIIPQMSKNIYEGIFRGIGQRAKLAAAQVGEFAKSQYQQARQNATIENERSISDLESQFVHAPIAKQLGVKTSAIRDILSDPSHPNYQTVRSAIGSNRQANVMDLRGRVGRLRNAKIMSDANRVLSSNISSPQQQATLRNQAAYQASAAGQSFNPAQFNRQNPVNPNLYGRTLAAARNRLRDTRRQHIDASIQQGVVSTAPGLRGKVSRVLARNPRLTRIFKAVDTFI